MAKRAKPSPTKLGKAIGRAIKLFRKDKRGMSQLKLARAVNIHPVFLSGVERGIHLPNIGVVLAIERALELPIGTLSRSSQIILDRIEAKMAERTKPAPARPARTKPSARDISEVAAVAEATSAAEVLDVDKLARELEA